MAGAALVVAIISAIAAIVSVIVTVWLTNRALQKADRANQIATQALNIERARLEAEQEVFVQPIRFEPNGGQVVYQVLSHRPVEEVAFEFRNYAGDGGSCHRRMLPAGEMRLSIREFDQTSDLATPGAMEFLARTTWKQAGSQGQSESGLYIASKKNYTFVRRDGT